MLDIRINILIVVLGCLLPLTGSAQLTKSKMLSDSIMVKYVLVMDQAELQNSPFRNYPLAVLPNILFEEVLKYSNEQSRIISLYKNYDKSIELKLDSLVKLQNDVESKLIQADSSYKKISKGLDSLRMVTGKGKEKTKEVEKDLKKIKRANILNGIGSAVNVVLGVFVAILIRN